MHAALTIKVLMHNNSSFLEELSQEDFKQVRKIIIKCILATDMKDHFPHMKSFKEKLDEYQKHEGLLPLDK
jgi:3'5'-cyclic nucleotide phosphodiesterase